MICPYCKKEIPDSSVFCDGCGQSILQSQDSAASNKYWSNVEAEDKKRDQQYKKDATAMKSQRNSARAKSMGIAIAIIIAVIIGIFIAVSVSNSHAAALEEVKSNLPGKELSCNYSRTETGFWIHYYYYTLEFNDDGTLDYYYLTTVGPAEDDELPTHKGTYTYSITRNILGDYIISFGSESFTMTVSDSNVPRSISYGK